MPRLAIFFLLAALPLTAVNAELLQLKNGDRVSGEIVGESSQHLVLDHPLLGQLVLNKADLVARSNSSANTINATQTPAPASPVKAAKAVGPGILNKISQRLEVGFSGATGNSRNSDLRLGYQRRSESTQRHSLLKSGYQRETSDGNTQENELFAELTYDWLMPESRWFRFGQGRYDWDDFEEWNSRISVSGGSGYYFIDRAGLRLAGRAGLGLTQTIGGEADELDPEATVGVDANWQINPRQSLEFANNLALQLDQPGELRNLTSLAWLIKLDQFNGIDLKFGINNEYESEPAGTSSTNDFKYNLSLTWQLK